MYWNLCVRVSACPCIQVLSWRVSSERVSLCLMFVYVRSDWFCRLTRQNVDVYVRRAEKCAFAYDLSLTVLRWPCVVDRTLKSNYYYYY